MSYRSMDLFEEREVAHLLLHQGSVARGDADSHKLTTPRSIGLADGSMLNVLRDELLLQG